LCLELGARAFLSLSSAILRFGLVNIVAPRASKWPIPAIIVSGRRQAGSSPRARRMTITRFFEAQPTGNLPLRRHIQRLVAAFAGESDMAAIRCNAGPLNFRYPTDAHSFPSAGGPTLALPPPLASAAADHFARGSAQDIYPKHRMAQGPRPLHPCDRPRSCRHMSGRLASFGHPLSPLRYMAGAFGHVECRPPSQPLRLAFGRREKRQ
jgi:hypothetical protein